MTNKSKNINWIIELGLFLVYIILHIIHLYSFDEPYHSNINWLIRLCFKIFTVLYLFFGFAIFNGISIHNLLKKEAYTLLTGGKILAGSLIGLVMATHTISSFSVFYSSQLLIISFFLLFFSFAIVLVSHFIKAKNFTKRSLYRLAVPIIYTIFFMVMPHYFTRDILYRNHPKYLEALKKFEAAPQNMETYDHYLKQEELLWESKKKKKN